MSKNSHKLNAFILLEVLIALTIVGVAVGLFWNAKLANVHFHKRILGHLAAERLVNDAKILSEVGQPEFLELEGYRGLENFNWLPNGIVFKFKSKNTQEILF